MRLAGRRSPPRGERSGRQDSNLRLPAPEAGGVPAPQRPDECPPASSAPGFQSSGGRARTCALAGNNRASYRLDHAGIHGPGRRRTCTAPGKSRELCRVELRSLAGCGRQESNLRRPAFQAGALPAELRPRDGRGWVRTSGLLCVRQALSRSELLARSVSAPVRLAALPSISPGGDRRTSDPRFLALCLAGRSRTMFSKPLAYPSTLDRTSAAALPRSARPSWRSFGARCSCLGRNCRAK